ncbi:MAG: substrate-binding domain-containing protein [Oscillospiraceae bacterium]|nr:substrate-binding domain-containing protein [Oscillospiraceae bacterium]
MKRLVVFAIFLALILPLAACGGTVSPEPSPAPGAPSPEISPPQDAESPVGYNPPMPPPEYPVIDGSSSTILMHAAIRAHLTGARLVDSHSQTYAALERLIPGHDDPADVLLSVKYYDETLQDAEDRGADLIVTPVAKEGFIFLVNKDNPVDSLTQQQLRDIYAGSITNWKEVGGNDEEIKPYTRNWDSGSQTAMEDFMDGVPITKNAIDQMLFSMSFMLEGVAYEPSAIGYNIYSWSMEQAVMEGVKLVTVDGVAPSNAALSDGSYPLIVYTYSYYNRDNAKGKALTDWLLTAEGQRTITSAGYVGIFGDLPEPDFSYYDDENASREAADVYYSEHAKAFGWNDYGWYGWRQTDRALIESLADGKGRDVTVLYLFSYPHYDAQEEYYWDEMRFIVLTREAGGKFMVINEGEWHD